MRQRGGPVALAEVSAIWGGVGVSRTGPNARPGSRETDRVPDASPNRTRGSDQANVGTSAGSWPSKEVAPFPPLARPPANIWLPGGTLPDCALPRSTGIKEPGLAQAR